MIDHEELPFVPFPDDCLPGPLGQFVSSVASSIGCDPSFVALPVLSVCGSAVGNAARLRLKFGYDVPPVIWSVVIGESGSGKSPAFDAAMRPLVSMEVRSGKEHAAAMELHKSRMKVYQRELKRWESKGDASTDPPRGPKEPIRKRYYTSDVTAQALAKLLSENPRGMLVAVDELDGWFGAFDKFSGGTGSDASQYLSMHGAGTITVDRKGDGTLSVPQAAVCIMGGIQPGVLRTTLSSKHRKSGLSARLLKASPPRRAKTWAEAGVSPEIEAGYAALIEGMYLLGFDGTDEDGIPKPHIVELSPDAKSQYITFVDRNSSEQLGLTGELASTWDKLESYAARFALIFHYVRVASGDSSLTDQTRVDATSMEQAIRLTEWLKHEARRVHAMLSPNEDSNESAEAKALAYIRRVGGRVTARELSKNVRSAQGKGVSDGLLQRFADANMGTWEQTSNGQSRVFVLLS